MATTLTRNLKLRINSNLTADSKYNLERLDDLAGTFLVDSTDTLNIRSRTDINIEPESADIDGSGVGGVVNVGTADHSAESVNIFAEEFNLDTSLGLFDQGTSGDSYMRIEYDSTLEGEAVDDTDRTLSVSLVGDDRQLVLSGSLILLGTGDLQLTLSGDTDLAFPEDGTVLTDTSTATVTNKSIDADANTITDIRNANVATDAAIAYSKLNLSSSIVNADISASAAIAYSKLALTGSVVNADIAAGASIAYSKLALASSIVNADVAAGADIAYSKLDLTGSVVNADISASAAIAYSKLSLTDSIVNADIDSAAAIAYSKLDLDDSIVNADISTSAAIEYSKLDLDGSIVDADIDAGAAISGAKTDGDFGSLTITTTGDFRPANGDGFYSSFSTHEDQAENVTYKLPQEAPTADQVLRANTSDPLQLEWSTIAGAGTVTSVDLSVPAIFSVSGNPITSSGTLAVDLAVQNANRIWAGPTTGAAAAPTFRALVTADIPTGVDHGGLAGLGDDDHTQYHNDSRALTWLGTRTADDLPVGVTNKYYSDTLFDTSLATKDTADLAEGSNLYFTDERAQDAVGTILTDTASVNLSYNDGLAQISADVLPAGVDHDSLQNYSANKHIDHTGVSITTGILSGLSGGGTIAATRTLLVDPTRAVGSTPALADTVMFADADNSNVLSNATLANVLALTGASYATDWTSATSKTVTHSLGSRDVIVQLYDNTTYETIYVDSVIRTNTNTVDLSANEAPSGSGWRVLVRKL
jgi:hypothetical protein